MVTPRSEMSGWHALHDTPIDPAITTPSTSLSSAPRNTWMGAELDSTDSIAQLAGVHFPEMGHLENSTGDASMSHLDFMALGGEDWRDWQGGMGGGLGTDLDGFPPSNGFGGFDIGPGGGRVYGGLING